ncbi:MAG TPA: sensor histidine kinase [Thermoleophilaceae bacterium]|jgi:two-component system sensor histidine kinase UhpB
MSRRGTLIGQTILVNVFLVTAVLFGATSAANLNLRIQGERLQFALLAMAIMLALLANIMMLRRRFSPLEQLIDRLERIDPAHGVSFDQPALGEMEEVDRLSATFKRLLERIESERRRSGRLVLRAQEEERKRVARDLHDEVNQALTAILLRLQALMQDAPSGELERELSEVKRLVNQAMEELLQLARQLRPTALDDHGLLPALEGQVRRFGDQQGIDARLRTEGESGELGDDQQLVVYRVAQEALANVARHAEATRVEVDLATREGGIDLCVRDNGRGFDSTLPPSGLGLNGMAERARLVGGELSVYSSAGRGTTVTLHVP